MRETGKTGGDVPAEVSDKKSRRESSEEKKPQPVTNTERKRL